MAEIDVKFMKGNRALARQMGNKIVAPKKKATKTAAKRGTKKK